jgi:hypothetical protein
MTASVDNLRVGKGIMTVSSDGSTWRDVGNCTSFVFAPTLEKLEHFSSREGVKTLDRTVIISKKGTLRATLEEFTKENLTLLLLGTETSTGAVEIFAENSQRLQVKFTDTNEVGHQFEWHFLAVDFTPTSELELLSEEWANFTLEGDVSQSAGSFGTFTLATSAA